MYHNMKANRPVRRAWSGAVLALVTVGVLLGVASPARADNGVDPAGRYVMTDSTEPGGPDFHPLPAPTNLFQTDNSEATVSLPFPFTFYDTTYTSVTVGANGALVFPAGQQVNDGPNDFDLVDQAMIAPWWSNWRPGTEGLAHGDVRMGTSGQAPNRVFVVWWHDVSNPDAVHDANPLQGTADFQVQLFEGSNRIEFHYPHSFITWFETPYTAIGLDNGEVSSLPYSYYDSPVSSTAIAFTPATCAGRRATQLGTFGVDSLAGTTGDDVIVTLDGDDVVSTGGGDDLICTGRGRDRVTAGSGDDRAVGGKGADDLSGGVGTDRLDGGMGRDTCRGGPGLDTGLSCEVRRGLP
jgi:Ca2+-binding RTX toxin-like protein